MGYCVETYRRMRSEGSCHSSAMFFAELNWQFMNGSLKAA